MGGVIYPGTFDPITNGHLDLIRRAALLFERVLVAVAVDTGKDPAFGIERRIRLAEQVLQDIPQAEVVRFSGLLVTFARDHGIPVVIRGLRNLADFEYESQLAGMNRRMAPEIETLFLAPAAEYAPISSSLVREIASLGGDLSPFVPAVVQAALRERFG